MLILIQMGTFLANFDSNGAPFLATFDSNGDFCANFDSFKWGLFCQFRFKWGLFLLISIQTGTFSLILNRMVTFFAKFDSNGDFSS